MELYLLLFVLIELSLSMLLQSLEFTLPILFIAMVTAFAIVPRIGGRSLETSPASGARLQCHGAFSIYLVLLLSFYILFTAKAHDARYIYFFHGKIIYFAGGLFQSTHWDEPAISFSHPDYPKLIAVLSAQIAYILGFWNEYLPKLSLLALAVPSCITLGRLALDRNLGLVLFLSFPMLLGGWLWNGYMDAYLAVFSGLSFICFWMYLLLDIELFIYLAIVYLGLCGSLKNEGLLTILCMAIGITAGIAACTPRLRIVWRNKLRIFLYSLIAIAPVIIWHYYTYEWSIFNQLELSSMKAFSRVAERISNGYIPLNVMSIMFTRSKLYFMLPLSLIAVVYAKRKALINRKLKRIIASAYIVSLLYFLGIFLVLMATPLPSVTHAYECNRILKPIEVWLASIFYFLMIARYHRSIFPADGGIVAVEGGATGTEDR